MKKRGEDEQIMLQMCEINKNVTKNAEKSSGDFKKTTFCDFRSQPLLGNDIQKCLKEQKSSYLDILLPGMTGKVD